MNEKLKNLVEAFNNILTVAVILGGVGVGIGVLFGFAVLTFRLVSGL